MLISRSRVTHPCRPNPWAKVNPRQSDTEIVGFRPLRSIAYKLPPRFAPCPRVISGSRNQPCLASFFQIPITVS
jgi:hypothetical protein